MLTGVSGLAAGMAHVLAGPDHLAAIAPLAIDRQRPGAVAWRVGALWGTGHAVGVVTLALLTRELFSHTTTARIAHSSELFVGFLLIGLGTWTLTRKQVRLVPSNQPVSVSSPPRDNLRTAPPSARDLVTPAASVTRTKSLFQNPLAFGIGIVHGMAGVGHFAGILPLVALNRPQAASFAFFYLIAVASTMSLAAWILGHVSHAVEAAWLHRLQRIAGSISLSVGILWTILALVT